MGGLQLVAAWGPRLDEHSGHGDHGQTAVVQLGSQLQLSLSRVLCCAGSSCSPEQGLISTASTQSGRIGKSSEKSAQQLLDFPAPVAGAEVAGLTSGQI